MTRNIKLDRLREFSGKNKCTAASVILVFVLVSCAAAPAKRYYTLANLTQDIASNHDVPICDIPLVIASVMAASPYRDEKIVFRSSDYEIRYYNYRFWVDPPEDMMMGLLQQKMANTSLFKTVEYRINSASEHLALYVKLNAIEERDREAEWYARIAMNFVLKTSDKEDVIWEYAFDTERKSKEQSTLGIVATLSDVYNEELNRVIASLSGFLPSYADCHETSVENPE